MSHPVTLATRFILLAGLSANAYFMLTNGHPGRILWWPLALVFYAWTSLPFVAIEGAVRYGGNTPVSRVILFLTALIVSLGGIFILVQAFIVHLDAQSALVFVIVPFYQCAIALFGICLSFGIDILRDKLKHR